MTLYYVIVNSNFREVMVGKHERLPHTQMRRTLRMHTPEGGAYEQERADRSTRSLTRQFVWDDALPEGRLVHVKSQEELEGALDGHLPEAPLVVALPL